MTEIKKEREFPDESASWTNSGRELGKALKAAREAKGLEYRDLTETTRLRPRFLEALERGDWDALPSPAFARGFVVTYARALGLDVGGLLDRYEDAFPAMESPLAGMEQSASPRRVRPSMVVLCLFLAGLVSAGVMLWSSREAPPPGMETESTDSADRVTAPAASTGAREKIPKKPGVEKLTEDPAGPATASIAEVEVSVVEEPQSLPPELPPEAASGETPRPAIPAAAGPEAPPPARAVPPVSADVAASRPLRLKASVSERTWVRISVDGQEPMEYIFPPGKELEWQASSRFDLLVGNAGGLALELNGKKIGPLGASGQVVRVRLPETAE